MVNTIWKALIGLLFLLGGAELAARIFIREPIKVVGASPYVEPDSDLGWRLQRVESGSLRTNTHGFRGAEYDLTASLRILLVGDAVSWGEGVADAAAIYPELLVRRLSARLEQPVTLLNASVPGYSTSQQARFLELYGEFFQPHLILHQFSIDDVIEHLHLQARPETRSILFERGARTDLHSLHEALSENVALYSFVSRSIHSRSKLEQLHEIRELFVEEPSEALEAGWLSVGKEIERIAQWTNSKQKSVVGIISPHREQVEGPIEDARPQRQFLDLAKGAGYQGVIDPLPLLQEIWTGKKDPLFLDSQLLSEAGHAAVAIYVEAYLGQRLKPEPDGAAAPDSGAGIGAIPSGQKKVE